jgi:hypothetical protein
MKRDSQKNEVISFPMRVEQEDEAFAIHPGSVAFIGFPSV